LEKKGDLGSREGGVTLGPEQGELGANFFFILGIFVRIAESSHLHARRNS
jgi:hypothetical protein